jgi:cysteine desulfurase family protein
MIYLDNAATSWPKPSAVIRAVSDALVYGAGNPGRTSHNSAMHAGEIIFECRERLARLFGATNPLRICLTSNTTEALNLAIKGLLQAGDHAICSGMEHNSVWRPLVALEERGVSFSVAQADVTGFVRVESVARQLRPNTKLIAIVHASNVNGVIQPIAEIASAAHSHGVSLLVDAAQSAGSIPIDVVAMGIDLLAFPGHKGLLGPQGTGGLYVSEQLELRPLKEGGTGSESNNPHQPLFLPDRLESGTLNLPGIAGLGVAARLLLETGIETHREHEAEMTRRLLDGLTQIKDIIVYGPPSSVERAAVVSFNICGMAPVTVARELELRADIASRPGLHCAWLAHKTLGTDATGTVRLSPGPGTTLDEIDTALDVVRQLARGRSSQ